MADGINFLNLGGTSAGLGSALGTGLGSGLQSLAQMKLQQMQQAKQAQALAPFVGGNQDLANKLMSLPEKERFAILQNLPGQGVLGAGQQQGGLGVLAGQGGNLFQTPLSPYQSQMIQQKERSALAKEEANKLTLSRQQAKDSNLFYKENIQPAVEEAKAAEKVNNRLKQMVTQSKGINFYDRIAEVGKKIPYIGSFFTYTQSTNATDAVKNKAKFIEDIRKQFVGKISNQQLDAYLAQFPDVLQMNEDQVKSLVDSLVALNDQVIQNSKIKREVFSNNPNISLSQLNDEVDAYLNQPQQSQQMQVDQMQPQQMQPQQMQPQQMQEQPQVTSEAPLSFENKPRGAGNVFEDVIKPIYEKGFVNPTMTALQTILPNIARIGDQVNKVTQYIPEGNIKSFIQKIRQTFAPTTKEAENVLKNLGVTDEQIKNPEVLVKTLKDSLPYVAPLLVPYAGGLTGTLKGIATLATAAAGSMAGSAVGGKIGELGAGKAGKDIGEVIGGLGGGFAASKAVSKGGQYLAERKAKKQFIKEQVPIEIEKERQAPAILEAEKNKLDKNLLEFKKAEAPKQKEFSSRYEKADKLLKVDKKLSKESANKLKQELLNINNEASNLGQQNKQVDQIIENVNYNDIEGLVKAKKILGNLAEKAPYSQRDYIYNVQDAIKNTINNNANLEYLKAITPINKDYAAFKNEYSKKNLSILKDEIKVGKKQLQNNFDSNKSNFEATIKAIDKDGGLVKELKDLGIAGGVSAFFGKGAGIATKIGTSLYKSNQKTLNKLVALEKTNPEAYSNFLDTLNKQVEKPSVQNLKAAKNAIKALFLLNK